MFMTIKNNMTVQISTLAMVEHCQCNKEESKEDVEIVFCHFEWHLKHILIIFIWIQSTAKNDFFDP